MATLALLVLVPYAHPSLSRLRVLTPLPEGRGLVVVPRRRRWRRSARRRSSPRPPSRPSCASPRRVALPAAAAELMPAAVASEGKPPRPIEDPSGKALTPFFRALAAVERKAPQSVARITYFGDSIVASDFVTATLRRKLRKRFGDAGHGFVADGERLAGIFPQRRVSASPAQAGR